MVCLALLVILLSLVLLFKKYNPCMVFLSAGLISGILAGKAQEIVNCLILQLTAMDNVMTVGLCFVYYSLMEDSGANRVLSVLSGKLVRKRHLLLLPLTILAGFAVNMLVPSAMLSASVSCIAFLPILFGVGMKRELCAAAVAAGSWGSVLNVNSVHNIIIADMAKMSICQVIAGHKLAALAGSVIIAMMAPCIAHFWERWIYFKQCHPDSGALAVPAAENELVDYRLLSLPFLPVAIAVIVTVYFVSLPVWQVLALLCLVVFMIVRKAGMSGNHSKTLNMEKIGGAIGLLVTASLFAEGLTLLGLTENLNDLAYVGVALYNYSAAFQPLIHALLTGSGDVAAINYNALVIPTALIADVDLHKVASTAYLSASLGRAMSPLSGVVIVCAKLSETSILELSGINFLPMVAADVAVMLLLW